MAAAQPLFASPVEWNFYGYRIVDNAKHGIATNVTASFKYRGYEIAMTTYDPKGSKIIVLLNKVLIDECGSVEAAVKSIDDLLNWRGVDRRKAHTGRWRSA